MSVQAQPIDLMTYNIRYDNKGDNENNWHHRKEKIVKLIEHYAPAVIGIQEGLSHQVEYLDESLPAYSYVGVGRDDGKTKGEYAAVFYNSKRLKVLESGNFWLSETPEKISVGWDASMERICTYARFKDKASGNELWVFNAHFDHRGKQAQTNSAKLVLDIIASKTNLKKDKVVFMGDLNVFPEEEAIQTLKTKLDDSREISTTAPYGPQGTFNSFKLDMIMKRRIDYIFVNNLKVSKHLHIDDRRDNNLFPSDHLPVFISTGL
jgi:endonuclease/exonuclease/phosphatase family metal-dependent hydrolase